jgi:hypothetical protein
VAVTPFVFFALDVVVGGHRARFFGAAVVALSMAVAFDDAARFFGAAIVTLFLAADFGVVVFVCRFFAEFSLTWANASSLGQGQVSSQYS